jgi:hypothetical protein
VGNFRAFWIWILVGIAKTRKPPEIPVGVPSQLLECRLDIAAAERSMKAAVTKISVLINFTGKTGKANL